MVRIIAGSAKGRTLKVPGQGQTRPTSDRVREAVFAMIASWLGTAAEPAAEQLAGIAFADFYAGSAAIALEAASRGAQPVLAVESHAPAATVIRQNSATVGLGLDLRVASAERVTATAPVRPYDVIWLDAPYAENLDIVLAQLAENQWLAPDALVVVERGRTEEPAWPSILRDRWSRRYGDTVIYFAQAEGPLDVDREETE